MACWALSFPLGTRTSWSRAWPWRREVMERVNCTARWRLTRGSTCWTLTKSWPTELGPRGWNGGTGINSQRCQSVSQNERWFILFNRNKRPLDSYDCPDQRKGKRAKSTNIYAWFFFKSTFIFLGKGAASSISCLNRPPKASFLWPHHTCMHTWIKLETTYKPPQGPKVFNKAPFVTFE